MAQQEVYRLGLVIDMDGEKETKNSLKSLEKHTEQTEKRMKALDQIESSPAIKLKDKLTSPLEKVESKINGFSKGVIKKFAAIATAASVLVGGIGLKDTIQTYAEFEQGMQNVQAVSMATADEIKMLTEEAKRLGRETEWSAVQVTEAEQLLAQAGFSAKENVAALPGLLNLASAGQLELSEATDIAAGTLKAFGLEAEETGHVADILAVAATKTNSDVQGLGEGMKYVGPVAKGLNMSLEETTAALGMLHDANIKGSQAGTVLRGALTRLAKPSEQAAQKMKEIGFNAFDSQGKLLPFDEVIRRLEKSTADMTDEQKANAMATIFGQEAMSGMLALVEQGPDRLAELTGALEDSEGAAQEMADTRLDSLSGQFEILKSAVEGAKIEIGEKLAPKTREFVEKATAKVPEITDKVVELFDKGVSGAKKVMPIIKKIASGIKKFSPLIAGLAASFATLKVASTIGNVIGVVGPGIEKLSFAFKAVSGGAATLGEAMTFLISPVGWIALAIGAAVVAGIALYKNWDKIKEKAGQLAKWISDTWSKIKEATTEKWNNIKETVSEKWSSLKETISGIGPAIKDSAVNTWDSVKTGTVEKLSGIKDSTIELWESIKTGTIEKIESIKTVIQEKILAIKNFILFNMLSLPDGIADAFDNMREAVYTATEGIRNIISGAWEVIKNIFLGALLIIIDIVTLNFEGLKEDMFSIWENIKEGFSLIWEGIKQIFISALTFIKEYMVLIWEVIKLTVTTVWTTIVDFLANAWSFITEFIVSRLLSIKESIATTFTNIKEFLTNTWQTITEGAVQGWTAFKEGISNIINTTVEWIKTTWNNTIEWFSTLPSRLLTKGIAMFTALKEGLASMKESVITQAKEVGTGIVDAIKELPGKMVEMGKNIMQGLANGIKSMVTAPIEAAKDAAGRVGESIRKKLGIASPAKVTIAFGEYTMEGLGVGIEKKQGELDRVTQGATEKVIKNLNEVNVIDYVPEANMANYAVVTEEPKMKSLLGSIFYENMVEEPKVKPATYKKTPAPATANSNGDTIYIDMSNMKNDFSKGEKVDNDKTHEIVEKAKEEFGKKLLEALKNRK